MGQFVSRIFFLELVFSLKFLEARKLREGRSSISTIASPVKVGRQSPPSYLLHCHLLFHLHVVISFWRRCMAYRKHCLIDKRMYPLNLGDRILAKTKSSFFRLSSNAFFPAPVPVGVIFFLFS